MPPICARRAAWRCSPAGLDDPDQGLSDAALDASQVLVWWGHVRHRDVSAATGRRILERIVAGRLSLIVLHSAHWATPFIEAMDHRTREEARRLFPDDADERVELEFVPPENRYQAPAADAVATPSYHVRKFPDGVTRVRVTLPICCFPAWRADGQPSFSRTLLPEHPIAQGIPAEFSLPQSEMYDEPLHVPAPDEVIFEDRWPTGEWFRSGMVWRIGRGRVFYFRPRPRDLSHLPAAADPAARHRQRGTLARRRDRLGEGLGASPLSVRRRVPPRPASGLPPSCRPLLDKGSDLL